MGAGLGSLSPPGKDRLEPAGFHVLGDGSLNVAQRPDSPAMQPTWVLAIALVGRLVPICWAEGMSVLEPQTLARQPPIILARGQPNHSTSGALLRPAPPADQAILWEHFGWEKSLY